MVEEWVMKIGGDIDPADLPMSREGFPRYEDESGEEVPYPYNNQEMASNPDPLSGTISNVFRCNRFWKNTKINYF
jgi:hypothetical protein